MIGRRDIVDEMPDDLILNPEEAYEVVEWLLLLTDDIRDVRTMLYAASEVALPRSFFWDC